jgi:hypothetical protein
MPADNGVWEGERPDGAPVRIRTANLAGEVAKPRTTTHFADLGANPRSIGLRVRDDGVLT